MKVELPDTPFKYLSDNTAELDGQTAFLKTAQNSQYLDKVNESEHHSIVDIDSVRDYFGLDNIKIIGITGTNGKTTTAAAIYSILLDLGFKVAMQGTRGLFINDEQVVPKGLTTPPVLETYTHIYQAVAQECDFFIMEVSSHAIVQERIEGLKFALKILTNITSDHLDFHKTQEEYIAVKNSFFMDETLKLINRDESKAEFNYKNAYSYSVEAGSSFRVIAYSLNEGLSAAVQYFSEVVDFHSDMHGFFNLFNLTAAVAAVKLVTELPLEDICNEVVNFAGVSGRMEVVSTDPLVIVDFAHTHDGMAQVLNALREKDVRVVFGAGGDRDVSKRPLMGQVAESLAKKIYITSDNPRNEDPDLIIEDIKKGLKKPAQAYVNANRKEAIAAALSDQEEGEVVLILGKGDETYQIIYDKKLLFDDREVAREILHAKKA
jgi:UDP-N-acetylmuramoyl-L-alanyl-D-glutamate--2,6-diaminopimelate ligase